MSTIELVNTLLYEEESSTLDFKSEQYKFIRESEENKAKLLKDIIAFANAWRHSDAHILVGVQEVKGGKSIITGITEDLDDAQLQQFVNNKINYPIEFSYVTLEIEEKKIGLITIPSSKRPVFLKRGFSKLCANTVYVRRGSSTDIASPDEIAEMGARDNAEVIKSPKVQPLLVYGEYDEKKSCSVDIYFSLPIIPNLDAFPLYKMKQYGVIVRTPVLVDSVTNGNYYSDFATYFKKNESTAFIKFGIRNNGNMVARDVRAVVVFHNLPVGSSVFHERHLPETPNNLNFAKIQKIQFHKSYNLGVEEQPTVHEAHIKFGKIQSKDTSICKERLCIRVTRSCQISAQFTIYSDDLDSPVTEELLINLTANEKKYSVGKIIGLATDSIEQSK